MEFESSAFRMNQVEIGWLAGIIDGEGSISLDPRSGTRMPRLSVPSTDYEILERCQKITGTGTITKRHSKNPAHKPNWQWKTSGTRKTVAILQQIAPFLVCPKKARRAKFLIAHVDQLCKIGGNYSPVDAELRSRLWEEFFRL